MCKKVMIQNLLLMVTSTSLLLLSVELALRFGLIENSTYQIMLCDGELVKPEKKILILGDSFIADHYRHGKLTPLELLEIGIGNRLYNLLVSDFQKYDAKILNTAYGGAGPFEYLTEMKTKGISFGPDLVLLFYFAGNDLRDVRRNRQNRGGSWNSIKNAVRPYIRRLYLYHFIRERLDILIPRFSDLEALNKEGIDQEIIDMAKENKINPWLLQPKPGKVRAIMDNLLMDSVDDMNAWEKIKEIISEIRMYCEKLDAEFFIIIFPHTLQVNDSHLEFYQRCSFEIDKRALSSTKPQKLMKDFCKEQAIPCLDLLPHFKDNNNQELFRINDSHLNEEGCEFSEKIILEFIESNSSRLWASPRVTK